MRSCSGEKMMSRFSWYVPRVAPLFSNSSMVTDWRYVYSARSFSVAVSRSATSLARFGGGSAARRGAAQNADAKMSAMANTSGFRATLFGGWLVLCVAGLSFARLKGIPNWAALPALAAFLIEYPFYLV